MTPGTRLRRAAGRLLFVAPACLCLLAPAAASAKSIQGDLSPRLAELAKPSVAAMGPAKQAATLDVAPQGQPGSLQWDGNRVLVDAHFDRGAVAGLADLRAAGARVVYLSRRYQTVTLAVAPADLEAVSRASRVDGVSEDLAPIVASAGSCPGSVVSAGDSQLGAPAARSGFGVDGSGVTVGILSDSFNNAGGATSAAADVASGDLPGVGGPCGTTPVNVLEDSYSQAQGATDEGRAMAQIVHDLAPGASLAFATAFFDSELPFADNIRRLAAPVASGGAGAKVIVDDVAYLDEPFFQDGPVAVAVKDVTDAGASYFSAAGNDNMINGGNDTASWEAPAFRSAGATPCPSGVPAGTLDCMNFDPNSGDPPDTGFKITVPAGKTLTVDLQWAQPWYGVTTDLDAYLLDANAGTLLAKSDDPNVSALQSPGEPVEIPSWKNTGATAKDVLLAINRCTGACDSSSFVSTPFPLKFVLMENGGTGFTTEYPISSGGDVVGPTVYGHAGSAAAIGVGAVDASSNPPDLEPYSSRGPVTHYFDPVDGTSAGAPLASPQTITKPDVVASDCVHTTFFYGASHLFCGTSAAAPHAAAIAALMLQRDPLATPAEVRAAMTGTAIPVGSFGPDAVGFGLLDASVGVSTLPDNSSLGSGSGGGGSGNPPTGTTKAGAPNTSFRRTPPKVVTTRHNRVWIALGFGADQAGSTFLCRFDGGPWRRCDRRVLRSFSVARHTVRVAARNSAGKVDPTPAVFRFQVKRLG